MSARENRERENERERERGVSLSLFLINHLFEKTSSLSLSSRAPKREREKERERDTKDSQKNQNTSALTLVACRTALSSLPEMLSPWWWLMGGVVVECLVWHLFLFCLYFWGSPFVRAKIRYETLNTEIFDFFANWVLRHKTVFARKETNELTNEP